MTNQPPSRSLDRIMIRLPDGMRDRLTKAAMDVGRSVNAEVVARLEKSFEDDSAAVDMAELVEQHSEDISSLYREIEDLQAAVGRLQRG